ncbi:MAG: hypothetical protein CM15mV104_010 [Caudoviricetes sp.]|nr:MAG: hypothetical protein CM15mV104_010 [Caudoviricetes sp.]
MTAARVKAVNTTGVFVNLRYCIGNVVAIDPPSNVEDLSCNITGNDAFKLDTNFRFLDLAFYQIRFSETIDGTGEWLNSVNLVTKVSRPATSITVPFKNWNLSYKSC